MALNIKDKETEALVAKIASLTGESETDAVRIAARERVERLELEAADRPRRPDDPRRSPEAFRHWLETEIWPLVPKEQLGKAISKAEREKLLGYGPDEA